MQKATDDQGETPEQEIERIRESAGRTIGVLRAEIDHLRAVVLPHARIQSHADGFQVGWHSAIDRFREGDTSDELRALVPDTRKKPLPAGLMKETDADQELSTIDKLGRAQVRAESWLERNALHIDGMPHGCALSELALVVPILRLFVIGWRGHAAWLQSPTMCAVHLLSTDRCPDCGHVRKQVWCETDSAPSKDQEIEKKEDSASARGGRDLSAAHPAPPREV